MLKTQIDKRINRRVICALLFIIILLIPVVKFNNSMLLMHLGIMVFVYILLSHSWNILAGLSGLFSLGHAAFYGIGGYCVGIGIMRLGLHPLVGLLMGIAISTVFALVIGAVSSKLSGMYFAMSTIAIGEVLRTTANQMFKLTNGSAGMTIVRPAIPRYLFYYIVLALVILCSIFFVKLRKSRTGSMFVAIRENENLAKTLGVKTTKYKTIAVIISSVIASTCGGFMAYYIQVVDPNYLSFDVSTKVIIISVIGGIGSVWGPIFGSVFILLEELIRGTLGSQYAPLAMVLYSVILVIIMMVKPDGIVSINVRKALGMLKKQAKLKRG